MGIRWRFNLILIDSKNRLDGAVLKLVGTRTKLQSNQFNKKESKLLQYIHIFLQSKRYYEKSLFCKSWSLYVPTGLFRRKTSIKALSGVVYTELLINYGETVHTQNVYN